jgi:hypothetical protein
VESRGGAACWHVGASSLETSAGGAGDVSRRRWRRQPAASNGTLEPGPARAAGSRPSTERDRAFAPGVAGNTGVLSLGWMG